MRIVTLSEAATNLLLDLAHNCVSGVLQFDYLSNGAGHRQSTALLKATAPSAAAPQAPEKIAPLLGRTDDGAAGHDIVRRYLLEIATRRRLSSSEEYRLARSVRDGDASARQQLIEHHLGLVVVMARRYRNRGLPLLDLIEEGNIGLMAAIRKFDPEMGHRFSTYAKWWVRQSIELALMTQTRVVHVPVHVTRAMRRQSKKISPVPVAEPAKLDMQRNAANFLLHDVSDHGDATERESGREPEAVIDTLPAPEHEQPEWHLQLVGQRRRLQQALTSLNDNERLVVRWRFGLEDDTTRTLEKIAAELKLSSERVRQIQAEALQKLRRMLALRPGDGPDALL